MPRHIFNLALMLKNFFSSSLMTRPNKLEGLSLETLSSQVLEFEGKARANPIGTPFRCFLLDKLLLLPANVRQHWKVIARYKHSGLFGLIISNEGKKFYKIDTCIDPYKRCGFSTYGIIE
jgi:hypothetical protein